MSVWKLLEERESVVPESWIDHARCITSKSLVHGEKSCHLSNSSHDEEHRDSYEDVRDQETAGTASRQSTTCTDHETCANCTSDGEHEDLVWLEVPSQFVRLSRLTFDRLQHGGFWPTERYRSVEPAAEYLGAYWSLLLSHEYHQQPPSVYRSRSWSNRIDYYTRD